MEQQIIEPFKLIGISLRTTNRDGKAYDDLGRLWGQFYSENISSKIPGKLSGDVYSVYTEYESDYTGEYTTVIGCRVQSLDAVPEGLRGYEFKGGKYLKMTLHGKMPDIIVDQWQDIWRRDRELQRIYTADFEIYSEKSQDPDNAEVELYLAVH